MKPNPERTKRVVAYLAATGLWQGLPWWMWRDMKAKAERLK